jgi:hypothetical protein
MYNDSSSLHDERGGKALTAGAPVERVVVEGATGYPLAGVTVIAKCEEEGTKLYN